MKTVKIPESATPWMCIVDGVKYTYPAGVTMQVPDQVAALVEAYNKEMEEPSYWVPTANVKQDPKSSAPFTIGADKGGVYRKDSAGVKKYVDVDLPELTDEQLAVVAEKTQEKVGAEVSQLKEEMSNFNESNFFPYADTYINNYLSTDSGTTHCGVFFFGNKIVESIKPNLLSGTFTVNKGRFKNKFVLNGDIEIIKSYGVANAGESIEINDVIKENEFIDIVTNGKNIIVSKEKTVMVNTIFKIANEKISGYIPDGRFCGTITLKSSCLGSNIEIASVNVALFGDSLCEYNDTVSHQFTRLLANRTGWNITNLAHSGTGFAKSYESSGKYEDYINDVPSNTRLILISASLNDLDSELPMGTWTDTARNTICGCINTFINNLLAKFPTSTVLCFTTTPWYNRTAESENVINYVNNIKKICGYYNIPFLELYNNTIIHTVLNTDVILNNYYKKPTTNKGDGIHPNNIGHEIIFNKLWKFINENVNSNGLITTFF